jgi:hypothetical protein
MALLDAYSRGLHALDMITLRTNMTQYYVQADGIPQFIVMKEDARKKATQAGMPIADVKLVMMALVAVLATQHFPHEVNDWEGLLSLSRMWQAWKVAFRLAHLKHQHQLQAWWGGGTLGGAHAVIPTAAPTIDCIGIALENLALVASNDTIVLQQLTSTNLALTASVTLLTAANKKLVDALAQNKDGAAPAYVHAYPLVIRGDTVKHALTSTSSPPNDVPSIPWSPVVLPLWPPLRGLARGDSSGLVSLRCRTPWQSLVSNSTT